MISLIDCGRNIKDYSVNVEGLTIYYATEADVWNIYSFVCNAGNGDTIDFV